LTAAGATRFAHEQNEFNRRRLVQAEKNHAAALASIKELGRRTRARSPVHSPHAGSASWARAFAAPTSIFFAGGGKK
jgi:hypothetical protein